MVFGNELRIFVKVYSHSAVFDVSNSENQKPAPMAAR
jgi:hypothetical protein